MQEKLADWLNSNDSSISPEMREQAQLALAMMEKMGAAGNRQTLTTEDLVAAGHVHKNEGNSTGPEKAFNQSFAILTGVEVGEDIPAFFSEIFGRDNGASDFYKGMYDSRFSVGVTEEGGFVSGVQNAKPEQSMPYSYQVNEDTGELEGPYYMFGYPAYQAALMETIGNANGETTTVEVDHNNVPLGHSNGRTYYDMKEMDYSNIRITLDANGGISTHSLLVRRNSENRDVQSQFKVFDEVRYYDPSRGMDDYSFSTNQEHRKQVDSVLADILSNSESKNYSHESVESFVEQMRSYFEEAFPLDNANHDIFENNRGRNFHPTQNFYKYLEHNQNQ